jgi:S-adenosylmethionine synthetase
MFGYATNETDDAMPLTLLLAHKLTNRLRELRANDNMSWLWPDAKSQV